MSNKEIVMRYKVLFHDASPSMIEQLIRKLIKESQGKKPEVTEEWIEKKALVLCKLVWDDHNVGKAERNFIRSLVEELKGGLR